MIEPVNENIFKKYLNHPVYVLFLLVLGVLSWLPSFESAKVNEESIHLSSIAADNADIKNTEYEIINRLSDTYVLSELEKSKNQWFYKNENDFSIAPDVVEKIDAANNKKIPKRFKNNPVFQIINDLEQISDDTAAIETEDVAVCDDSRKYYEKQIISYPQLKDLLTEREEPAGAFSKKCVTHIMNKFSVSNMSYAVCAKAQGTAKLPGEKPCVTNNLVNLTYNAYMDVTDCLNLNAKMLAPKLSNESGFFLNTFGGGKDGGVGQLTHPAISEVNNYFDTYMREIEKAAVHKASCANLLKYKSYLTKASDKPEERCSLIGLPENPIRNILYMGLLNRINMDQISGIKYVAGSDYLNINDELIPIQNNAKDEMSGTFKNYEIKQKLEILGMKNPNMHFFKEIIGLAGYNMGVHTAAGLLRNYLEKRIVNKLPVTLNDFDFNNPQMIKDANGAEKSVVSIARSYVMSSFISPNDDAETKIAKVKRRKELPKLWATAHTKTFPEYLAYKANGYDGKSLGKYTVYGFPGYLNLVANKNKDIRLKFENSGLDQNLCSDADFLKMKTEL